ncbi:MAG: hypothetical protein JWR21_4359 [Herminiimonas sp.]|nr:hypothetical protein [Herminiimonas sp.]
MPYYQLAIFGAPEKGFLDRITKLVESHVAQLGLKIGSDVTLFIGPADAFIPIDGRCSAALFFGIAGVSDIGLADQLAYGLPIIPIASTNTSFSSELPAILLPLNGLSLDKHTDERIVTALLECAGLLPRQRRVFISYKRTESIDAALQLYAALAARLFDVFLDTHGIHPADHFQEMLWRRLCDSDVLVMLDTNTYFNSRWTTAECGRAQAKGIGLLRVAWPHVAADSRVQTATSLDLVEADFVDNHILSEKSIERICNELELVRTKSIAVRHQSLVSTMKAAVEPIGGVLDGVSLKRSIIVTLPNKRRIAAYPTLGVPTTNTLHDATLDGHAPPVAVIYDDIGVDEKNWREHMDWIQSHVSKSVRLVSSYKAGWDFADWN